MLTGKFILHNLTAISGLVAAVQAYHYQQDYGYLVGRNAYDEELYDSLNSRDLYDDSDYYLDRRDDFSGNNYYDEVLLPRYLDMLYEDMYEELAARGLGSSLKSAASSVKSKMTPSKPEQSKPFNNKEGAIQKVRKVSMQGTKEGVTGIGELATKKLGDHAATSWKNAKLDALSTGYKNSAGTGLSKNQRQSLRNQAALDMYKED